LENSIYIILGIIWVIYSLYSARQKALQKQQSKGIPPTGPSHSSPLPIPGNKGGEKSIFDEIFRELSGIPPAAPQPVKSYTPPETFKPTSSYTPIQPSAKNTENAIYTGITSEFQSDTNNKDLKTNQIRDHLTQNRNNTKNFDLREAVIYSELLNRKYF